MKICFLAPASVIHTVRWVNAMVQRSHEIHLITMHDEKVDKFDKRVKIHRLKVPAPFGYYLNVIEAKRIVKKIQPDLLHAHYASGYGTLARLINYTPTLLSVWGSDVYLFPYESKRNEKVLRKNLMAADFITSTSKDMKRQTERFVSNPIEVVPFGIDIDLFQHTDVKDNDTIVIGTVKKLEHVYGIDILIEATALLISYLREHQHEDLANRIRLRLVGKGPQREELIHLTEKWNIRTMTEFVGYVANNQVVDQLNQMDIFAVFSRSESFGVAVLEASACKLPVVVSNVGGLPEVVQDGQTGFIVPLENMETIVESLARLVINEEKRRQMGKQGRSFVRQRYMWENNVSAMEKTYEKIIQSH